MNAREHRETLQVHLRVAAHMLESANAEPVGRPTRLALLRACAEAHLRAASELKLLAMAEREEARA